MQIIFGGPVKLTRLTRSDAAVTRIDAASTHIDAAQTRIDAAQTRRGCVIDAAPARCLYILNKCFLYLGPSSNNVF
jgi:hypothetical protein